MTVVVGGESGAKPVPSPPGTPSWREEVTQATTLISPRASLGVPALNLSPSRVWLSI